MEPFSSNQYLSHQEMENWNPWAVLLKMKYEIEVALKKEIERNCHLHQLLLSKNFLPSSTSPTNPRNSSEERDSSKKETTDKKENPKNSSQPTPHQERVRQSQFIKNGTKNIPKNYGKAIITFVESHPNLTAKVLREEGVCQIDFVTALKQKKKGINSITDLRNLWLQEEFRYAKQMRKLSLYFMKRGALSYVFSSKISNIKGHIKYRKRLIEVLRRPQEFTSVKNY